MKDIKSVEMQDAVSIKKNKGDKPLNLMDLKRQIQQIEKAVDAVEPRYINRVMRTIPKLRKKLNINILEQAVNTFFSKETSSMDIDGLEKLDISQKSQNSPEVELYFGLLILIFLIDNQKLDKTLKSTNRRTVDKIGSKELFPIIDRILSLIHSEFLSLQRLSTIRHDDECQATLINILLRDYINQNHNEQAEKFISKIQFPENVRNNQVVRYMYYIGKLKALQLEYTEAHNYLLQAVRKAPQSPSAAGFLQAVHKLAAIVELLMGEIPERSIFRQPMLKKSLAPYFALTQSVRIGDLEKFQSTLNQYSNTFHKDKTFNLILRLRHNVIKTGIKRISLAYSKISLKDICLKLHLDNEQDAEYIVAKAIRDGVIEASINHEKGYIESKENIDIYKTNEPQASFHQRISFCLSLYNESVKAMRYPMNAHKKDLASAEEARERERELVKEISEADIDDDDDVGDF